LGWRGVGRSGAAKRSSRLIEKWRPLNWPPFFYARPPFGCRSLAVFVGVELALAAVIRDNLTLNIIMLIHPLETVKGWQIGG
jgi:hypothetical protein